VVWTYGAGTGIYNIQGMGRRFVFHHGAGTVTFVSGREPVAKLGSGRASSVPVGG
jgi:hypothetical protein